LKGPDDDDTVWESVSVLRLRGTPEVFDVARLYCASENSKARARGLSVLAQLGAGKPDAERPFIAASVSIAIDHLQDSNLEVVRCAVWALSHLGTGPGVTALIGLRNHSDPEVRQAVACCIELRKHSQAVSILIALMEDQNEVVRDWASFALGSDDYEQGGPEINAALHRRLVDNYEEARREAIWGLARRRDPVGLKLLLDLLESDKWWSGDEFAAEEILDAKSGTPLQELQQGLRNLVANIPVSEIP
jgi:HEAT repeat protein